MLFIQKNNKQGQLEINACEALPSSEARDHWLIVNEEATEAPLSFLTE